MKRCFYLFFLFLLPTTDCHAQDLITTKTGEDIAALVTEIGLTDVKYQLWKDTAGGVVTIPKEDILIIRYQDGGKEIFEADPPPATQYPIRIQSTNRNSGVPPLGLSSMFNRGQLDAKRYYNGYKSSGTAALIGTLFLGPLVGLVFPLAIGNRPPETVTLNYPSESLMRNSDYAAGYVAGAQKIRSDKTWLNYAIGAGLPLVIVGLIFGFILLAY